MIRTSLALCCLLIAPTLRPAQTPGAVTDEPFAIRFGILPGFPVPSLVARAARDRRLDIPVLIVPGHDPAVFERFERVADGIVRIK
jgi:hypothetical protein